METVGFQTWWRIREHTHRNVKSGMRGREWSNERREVYDEEQLPSVTSWIHRQLKPLWDREGQSVSVTESAWKRFLETSPDHWMLSLLSGRGRNFHFLKTLLLSLSLLLFQICFLWVSLKVGRTMGGVWSDKNHPTRRCAFSYHCTSGTEWPVNRPLTALGIASQATYRLCYRTSEAAGAVCGSGLKKGVPANFLLVEKNPRIC